MLHHSRDLQPIFFSFFFLLYKIQFNKLTKWKSFKKVCYIKNICIYKSTTKNINSFLSFVKLETIMYTCCVAWQNSIMSFLCHISVFLKWDVFFLIFFHFLLYFLGSIFIEGIFLFNYYLYKSFLDLEVTGETSKNYNNLKTVDIWETFQNNEKW